MTEALIKKPAINLQAKKDRKMLVIENITLERFRLFAVATGQ